MHASPQLVSANTCSCGKVVLLATDRATGRTLCTGSFMDETAGVYHTRYGCRASDSTRLRSAVAETAPEHRGPCCGVLLCDECAEADNGLQQAIARAELVNERVLENGGSA